MNKTAYDLGVKEALTQLGLLKKATVASSIADTLMTSPAWARYVMGGTMGAGLGGGIGALASKDPGEGLLRGGGIGALAGLGGAGAIHALNSSPKLQQIMSDVVLPADMEAKVQRALRNMSSRGLKRHAKVMENRLGHGVIGTAGLGAAAGGGIGAGINSAID